MKRTSLLATALLALGLVFSTAGCSTYTKPSAQLKTPGTFALIVSVSGGRPPTDAQWATMQKNFSTLLAGRGLTLVTDPTQAEKLIQVLFVPDLDNPDTGISYIVNVRNNPGNLLASTSRANAASTTSFGFGSAGYGYSSAFGQQQYYGYYPDYTDISYTSSPGSTPVTPPTHGGGHHVTRPVDCPPDTTPHHPGGYAGNNPSGGNGNHWWNSRPSSEPSPSRSSYSPSYSSYSSSSYSSSSDYSSGPSTSYSSSSSSSSPSISFPSSSSSSYSSEPSSSSSSSSSPSISFPGKPN